MDEIINNLQIGDVLYITANGTPYFLVNILPDNSIVYSINNTTKNLPIATINTAAIDAVNCNYINAAWYHKYNWHEYNTRPCNLKVLQELIVRLLAQQ